MEDAKIGGLCILNDAELRQVSGAESHGMFPWKLRLED